MKNNDHNGFMLIEILIALAILSLGLVVLIQSMSSTLKTVSKSWRLVEATNLAESKLAQIRSGYCDYGVSRGDFGDSNPGFSWEIEALPAFEHVDKISLKILWSENDEKKNILIETLLAKK
ncbi:MAG: type II secretion system protein [bacterium]|nr:type II secretion system protein [bacterium]